MGACPEDGLFANVLSTFSHGVPNPAASQKGVVLDQSLRKASFLSHSALPKRKGHVRSVRLGLSLSFAKHLRILASVDPWLCHSGFISYWA